MAVISLQADSANVKPNEFDRLYAVWRFAKATLDAQTYSPENYADGLPDEIESNLCGSASDALNAFLMYPATTNRELALKLRVFRDEEIEDGWAKASEIVASIAADAHHIAYR